MSSFDTQSLVSSKENIQPLRRGRDTSILCAALQAATDTSVQHGLEKQRNEFEIKLRSDTSEDPLANWCSYIHWIEQSFPKQPREGKLNVVLQKCLNKFKDSPQYMNDIRFVKLCIKYAELEDNTVELLSQIHRHGIGVSCAQLYIAWAEKYAIDDCFKKANAIYERGLQCSAQPLELLQEAHKNFQAFLVRKMINERETFQPTLIDNNPAEQRQPYNILQTVTTSQKDVVPSIRVGSNVIGPIGKMQKLSIKEQKPKNNAEVKVFEDPHGNFISAEPKAKIEKVLNKRTLTKENIVKPGTWNNKKNRNTPFTVDSQRNVPFQVHRDEDDSMNKKEKVIPSSVLKSHKGKAYYEDENFVNAPLFYPEPFDPTKVAMYCKEQVYAGGLEFQFEELRAIQYRRKYEEKLKSGQIKVFKHTNGGNTPKPLQEVNHFPDSTKSDLITKSKTDKTRMKLDEVKEKKSKLNNGSPRKSCNPVPILVAEENFQATDYSMNQTIHTKEALSEMQQLWFSKPASPVSLIMKNSKPVAKSILKPSKPCFSLYVDESCLENFKPLSEDKPLDLTLKSNENCDSENEPILKSKLESGVKVLGTIKKKTGVMDRIERPVDKENFYSKENFDKQILGSCESKLNDENKENGIPDDYHGPVGKSSRKVSGILTPAENIEIAQLSDEEIEIEVDEVDDGDGMEEEEAPLQDFSSIIQCNTTTITETWNLTKGFQFPRGESTPNLRKSFHNKADFNESVYVPGLKSSAAQSSANLNSLESNSGAEVNSGNIPRSNEQKLNDDGENINKNLSVIAETSREYRSSSSGSSGVSTLRSSKPTLSECKTSKLSLTSSRTTTTRTKLQNYTGYEASSESSHIITKTQSPKKEDNLNVTFDLMQKLNAIESVSVNSYHTPETKTAEVIQDMSRLKLQTETPNINENILDLDPFSEELITNLLREVDFPKSIHASGYFLLHDTDLPVPKVGSSLTLGAYNYEVKKNLGEGAYAKVFQLSAGSSGESVIAKFQKPACPWEFYIVREIQSRIKNNEFAAQFMSVESAFFFQNCSILLSRPVEFGDLLAVINRMKQGNMMCETIAMHFTCQILKILETLHSCKIIHGDLKPDNLLLRQFNGKLQLQLIDFGRSIDMSLFPEGTKFTRVVSTKGFTTVEMRLKKSWTYQIDLYGAANCGHCLLFGEYMKVSERNGVWNINRVIPRYWARTEWKNFFTSLINVESCTKLPDLSELRKSFEAVLAENSEIEFSLFKLNNLLNDR